MLRFRDLGVFVFEFWVLRFRFRVLRFRDLGASCFGLRFRVLRFRNYLISCALRNCFAREGDDFLRCFVTRSCRMLNSHG